MKTKMKVLAAATAMTVAGFGAMAANQGLLGLSSTGDLLITLVIPESVRVSNLADIDLGQADGVNDSVGTSPVCVYRGGAVGTYQITTTSTNGGAGSYLLSGGTGPSTLAYSVSYDEGGGAQAMTSGTVLAGQTNANNTNDDCATAGADTGALTVTVTAANANGVSGDPGTYTDTLVVLVAAE